MNIKQTTLASVFATFACATHTGGAAFAQLSVTPTFNSIYSDRAQAIEGVKIFKTISSTATITVDGNRTSSTQRGGTYTIKGTGVNLRATNVDSSVIPKISATGQVAAGAGVGTSTRILNGLGPDAWDVRVEIGQNDGANTYFQQDANVGFTTAAGAAGNPINAGTITMSPGAISLATGTLTGFTSNITTSITSAFGSNDIKYDNVGKAITSMTGTKYQVMAESGNNQYDSDSTRTNIILSGTNGGGQALNYTINDTNSGTGITINNVASSIPAGTTTTAGSDSAAMVVGTPVTSGTIVNTNGGTDAGAITFTSSIFTPTAAAGSVGITTQTTCSSTSLSCGGVAVPASGAAAVTNAPFVETYTTGEISSL